MFPRETDAKIAIAIGGGIAAVLFPLHMLGVGKPVLFWVSFAIGPPLGLYLLWRLDRDE